VDVIALRAYCLSKPSATADHPFGSGTLVMKVRGKMFAIIGEEGNPITISLKCEPEIAPLLRSAYKSVSPGYHLNKKHWNSITLDGDVPLDLIRDWIDDSYDLVVAGLTRREREAIRDSQRDMGLRNST
jgi:predicted DNA-binding protein (MmcQ/YjbR family)